MIAEKEEKQQISIPLKKGLDYFPHYTGVFGNRKIRRLLTMFGAKGYLIYSSVLCAIYRENGYYILHERELACDIADSLAGSGIKAETVSEVIHACVTMGIFDNELVSSHGILTSAEIQETYLATKRMGAYIDPDFLVSTTKAPVNTLTRVNRAASAPCKIQHIKQGVSLPLSAFAIALADFEEMRKKHKNPYTPRARQLVLNRLEKLSGGDERVKIQILEQSTLNGWAGVFPLRQEQTEYSKQQVRLLPANVLPARKNSNPSS